MAISSTGGADAQDTGGAVRVSGTTTEELGGVIRSASDGTDTTTQGTDTQTDTLQGGQGNDSIAGSTEGNDTIAAGDGNDTISAQEGNDTISGGRSDDEIRASLKEAGGIFADPRYEAGALEFEKTGDVTEATRDKLASEFNVPRNAVDSFIEGQKAQRQMASSSATAAQAKTISELHAVVGTEADYGKFMEWSKENLSAEEKAAYNNALDHAPDAAKVLLASFNAKYKAAGNGAPRDLTEEAAGATAKAATGYGSSAEMQADMSSKRYETDPAFRDQVAARVAVSKF